MNKIKKWVSVMLSVLLVCLLLAGCGNGAEPDSQPSGTQGEDGASNSSDVQDTTPKKLEIETPVGTLTFPEEWAGDVQTKDTSADGTYAMSFYGTVNGADVLLFEIAIGAAEGGYQLGSAPDADGNMQSVWLNISEIKAEPEWSEADTARINTLQECVNELIYQLQQLDGFQPAN